MACRSRFLCQTARIFVCLHLVRIGTYSLLPVPDCLPASTLLCHLMQLSIVIHAPITPCHHAHLKPINDYLLPEQKLSSSLHSTDPSMSHILKGPEIPSLPTTHFINMRLCIFFQYLLFCCCCLAVKSRPAICNPKDSARLKGSWSGLIFLSKRSSLTQELNLEFFQGDL